MINDKQHQQMERERNLCEFHSRKLRLSKTRKNMAAVRNNSKMLFTTEEASGCWLFLAWMIYDTKSGKSLDI